MDGVLINQIDAWVTNPLQKNPTTDNNVHDKRQKKGELILSYILCVRPLKLLSNSSGILKQRNNYTVRST